MVYFSTSVGLSTDEDLAYLLEQSRRNNARTGITGVMLYVRGSIIQVLEGDKETLDALYERIRQDQRHTAVTRVLNRPIAQRLFDRWGMGYETITARQFDDIQTIVDVNAGNASGANTDDHIILKTIQVFYDSNRYN